MKTWALIKQIVFQYFFFFIRLQSCFVARKIFFADFHCRLCCRLQRKHTRCSNSCALWGIWLSVCVCAGVSVFVCCRNNWHLVNIHARYIGHKQNQPRHPPTGRESKRERKTFSFSKTVFLFLEDKILKERKTQKYIYVLLFQKHMTQKLLNSLSTSIV